MVFQEKGTESLFKELIDTNIPNLEKELDMQEMLIEPPTTSKQKDLLQDTC